MARYVDKNSYESIIYILNSCSTVIQDKARQMNDAMIDCVDNIQQDEHVVSLESQLKTTLQGYGLVCSKLEAIVRAMKDELQAVEEAAARINN